MRIIKFMCTAADLDGFNLDEHYFAQIKSVENGEAGTATPGNADFTAARNRAIRHGMGGLEQHLAAIHVAGLLAAITIADAADSARLAATAATATARNIPLSDLIAEATLPASTAAQNISPKIVPTPRF